jgi:hypothetical protein
MDLDIVNEMWDERIEHLLSLISFKNSFLGGGTKIERPRGRRRLTASIVLLLLGILALASLATAVELGPSRIVYGKAGNNYSTFLTATDSLNETLNVTFSPEPWLSPTTTQFNISGSYQLGINISVPSDYGNGRFVNQTFTIGNGSAFASAWLYFITDNTPPTISNNTPNFASTGIVNISASLSDNYAVERAEVYLNGANYSNASTFFGNSVTLSTTLPEGDYNYSIIAYDFAENVAFVSQNFSIITHAPVIAVNYSTPTNNTLQNISLCVNGSGLSQVLFNGSVISLNSNHCKVQTVALTEGQNALSVSATNLLNQTISQNFQVQLDTTPPQIDLLGNGSQVIDYFVIIANITDATNVSSAQYQVDNGAWSNLTPSSGYFVATINTLPLSLGPHNISVRAYDYFLKNSQNVAIINSIAGVEANATILNSGTAGTDTPARIQFTIKTKGHSNFRIKVAYPLLGNMTFQPINPLFICGYSSYRVKTEYDLNQTALSVGSLVNNTQSINCLLSYQVPAGVNTGNFLTTYSVRIFD